MRFCLQFLCCSSLCWLLAAPAARADEPALLQETPTAGQQFRVKCRGDLQGALALPAAVAKPDPSRGDPAKPEGKKDPKAAGPAALTLSGSSLTEYDEAWLPADGAAQVRACRVYRTQDYRRTIGQQKQESALRPEVRRLVLIPQRQKELVFSPDGPLTFNEIEQAQLDAYTPRLAGLLPGKAVRIGERWNADQAAIAELADMEVTGGDVACKLLAIEPREGRRHAICSFSGLVTGTTQDGPCRQRIDGTFAFDLELKHLADVSLLGASVMLDAQGKEVGKIEGRFVLTRRRIDLPELRPDALAKLGLEPNDQNTALLCDEPGLGLRFIYPRRWTLKQADGRQIILDDGQGAGLLITLEPLAQLPTAAQFEQEAREALRKQGVTPLRADPPRRLVAGAEPLDQFRFEVENAKKERLVLDYYVLRLAAAGATAAFNCPAARAAETAPEAERLLRSLRLNPPRKK